MKKDNFNSKLREYAKTLYPKSQERDLVGKVYQSFNDLFGVNNCIQIGSYPRFTAITPVHDLDILYILGSWDENNHTPLVTLTNLFNHINSSHVNPTNYTKKVSLQTHSVTVEFWQNSAMILSVDIVPAYLYGKNEFNQDTYKVPEVIKESNHVKRNTLTWDSNGLHSWIKSDPRGYIKTATEVDTNSDFRKAVKLVKRWKHNLCLEDGDLKLKSFHVEQVITKMFQKNPNIDIYDAVFAFFYGLPNMVDTPNQIADRANSDKYIDDYLSKFTSEQKEKIKQARDGFLIKLESIKDSDPTAGLLAVHFYERSENEEFMFDKRILILTEPQHSDFSLFADVTDKQGAIQRRLNSQGVIDSGRYLKFSKSKNIDGGAYDWKVKNDDTSEQPRGEITSHQTKNVPEHTKYRGTHYIECYAIKGGVCVASAKHNVVLN